MSTKTTLKRLALVAVSALGVGVFSPLSPAIAADEYYTNYSTTLASTTITQLDGYSNTDLGVVTINVIPTNESIKTTQTGTLTIAPLDGANAKDVAFAAALSFANTGYSAANTSLSASYNSLNNGTASFTGGPFLMTPTTAGFPSASAKAYLKLASGLTAATHNGAKVTLTLTKAGTGLVQTAATTLTLNMGDGWVRGTPTFTPTTKAANIAAGATGTATVVVPYTMDAEEAVTAIETFVLSGSVLGRTFNVTAAATGGAVTIVRTDASTITANVVKDNNAATALSVTYTISVTAPATAQNTQNVIVTPASGIGAITWTVFGGQTWNGTVEVDRAAAGTGWLGGDLKVYAPASVTNSSVATVDVDTNINTGNPSLYPAWVFSISGVGYFSLNGGTNKYSYLAVPASAAKEATVDFFADGRPGTSTLTVTANGSVVATQVINYYGTAASIKVTPVYTIGKAGNGLVGADVGAIDSVNCGYLPAECIASTDNDPALVVEVLDALGTRMPIEVGTSSDKVTVSSSNTAVVPNDFSSFLDAGVPSVTAGTLVNHVAYTTGATSKSGDSATLTFSYINSLGAVLTATQAVTIGGGKTGGTVTMSLDKTTYEPGERMVLTITGKDSSGNKVYDNLAVGTLNANKNVQGLASGYYYDGAYVLGDDAGEDLFAPAASGAFDIILYSGTASGATVKVTANVAEDAATIAANAASDAAAEAIDAANAATDAANLAAEAADAATVAAEEARDAADAATAAIEELASQVATLMAALKAQITTLANTVAKIAKKIKA